MNKIIEQIEKIKQINSNENLVIFVGAGVSKNSGVCSWWELVKEIADKIGENKCTSCEIKDLLCGECGEQIEMCSINGYNCKLKYDFSAEDFLRIPQHFYESFGDTEEEKKTYYDFLKEKFCSDEYETNIIDEIIVKLQPEHIITTNYDHLLENVNDPRVSKYAIITKDNDILSKKGRNYIIKMHGDIDDIQNIVLKEDDYLNYSQNHIIIETFIKSLLIDKTFLFVGYSLNDNNLKLIMSYIDFFVKEKRVENRQPHYLVVDKIKDCAHDISYWKNKGVELVDLSQISDYMIDNSNCENISNDIGKKLYAFLYYLNNEGLAYTNDKVQVLNGRLLKFKADISCFNYISYKTILEDMLILLFSVIFTIPTIYEWLKNLPSKIIEPYKESVNNRKKNLLKKCYEKKEENIQKVTMVYYEIQIIIVNIVHKWKHGEKKKVIKFIAYIVLGVVLISGILWATIWISNLVKAAVNKGSEKITYLYSNLNSTIKDDLNKGIVTFFLIVFVMLLGGRIPYVCMEEKTKIQKIKDIFVIMLTMTIVGRMIFFVWG